MDRQLSSVTKELVDAGRIDQNEANAYIADRRSKFEQDISALEAKGPLERGAAMNVVTDLMTVTGTEEIDDKTVNIPAGLAEQMKSTGKDGDLDELEKSQEHIRSKIGESIRVRNKETSQQFPESGENYNYNSDLGIWMSPIGLTGPVYKPFGLGVKEINAEERKEVALLQEAEASAREATKRQKAKEAAEPGLWDDFTYWFNSRSLSLGGGHSFRRLRR